MIQLKVYTEQELSKAYYSIGELAEMFDVNTSLIRFWQKEFHQHLNPKVNARGKRFFRPKDVVNFSKIYFLIKVKGYTLDGAKASLKSKETEVFSTEVPFDNNKESMKEELIQRLESLKQRLITFY